MAPTGLIYVLHCKFVTEKGQNVLQCKNVKKVKIRYYLNEISILIRYSCILLVAIDGYDMTYYIDK